MPVRINNLKIKEVAEVKLNTVENGAAVNISQLSPGVYVVRGGQGKGVRFLKQ